MASNGHHAPKPVDEMAIPNLGIHLANRLVEVGCTTAFGVPGDFNLILMDQLLKHPRLDMVWCCNELNAGYAADGYARKKGVGCVVATFGVGGFSLMNAVAGAMAEDLPVIVILGSPNSNDYAQNRILHHSIGSPDFTQQIRAFKQITCAQVTIRHVEDAHRLVDDAITAALLKKKPVCIEVCCNVVHLPHPSFMHQPMSYILPPAHINEHSLEKAAAAVAEVLNSSKKPVLLAGRQLRHGHERYAFEQLAKSSQYAVAITPEAKGMVPEDMPNFIGLYWGVVSWPHVQQLVDNADVVVTCGVVWTDVNTVGYSCTIPREKTISVGEGRVSIRGGATYTCITGESFMYKLAERVTPNPAVVEEYRKAPVVSKAFNRPDENSRLVSSTFYDYVQDMLTPHTVLLVETGDSWFSSQKLRLPRGCLFEVQMLYGSIGWSVGASLGYSSACKPITDSLNGGIGKVKSSKLESYQGNTSHGVAVPSVFGPDEIRRRVVSLVGDGSFQMTCQEMSTILRYNLNPIMFLINNKCYATEVELHDGPYNALMTWDYVGLIKAFSGNKAKLWTAKVGTERELKDAIATSTSAEHENDLCFIEVNLDSKDCSKELLEWGYYLIKSNSRRPSPQ